MVETPGQGEDTGSAVGRKAEKSARDWKHAGSVRRGTGPRAAREVGGWEVPEAQGRARGTAQAGEGTGQGGAKGRGKHKGVRVSRRLCPLGASGAL